MSTTRLSRAPALFGVAVLGLAACGERPPIDTVQIGFRGLAAEQNVNPRMLAEKQAANALPAVQPAAPADDTVPAVFQNVQVLTGVGAGEFTRTMTAISEWVVPDSWVDPTDVNKANKCAYCHNIANLASDEKYQKVVSRRMLQMVQHINGNYENHVKQTGVTCYTCHRGQPVPVAPWYYTNRDQPLRHYLDREGVLVTSNAALAANDTNHSSLRQATYTYNVMSNVSSAMGVNCTYCHSTRAFNSWDESTPKRLVALRGIRMVRDLNLNYMLSLQDVWPATRHDWGHLASDGTLQEGAGPEARRGPMGDGPKLQCATCHQGVYKPLFAAPMAKDYPLMYPGKARAVAAPVRMTSCSLPGGETLNVAETGIECRLNAFITDASLPVDKTTWFDFDRLLFATGKAELLPESQDQLGKVASILKAYPQVNVKVGGYTDNVGNPAANLKLSDARARNVRQALVDLGIDASRLVAEGYGEQYPVGDNATEAGRQQNRRISLRVTNK